MEQRIKASPTSPFFHSNHILHKESSNDDISIVSSFDSRSYTETRKFDITARPTSHSSNYKLTNDIGSFVSRQIDAEGFTPHGSRTHHFAEDEEEEDDLGLSRTNSTVSLSQFPTMSSTPPLNLYTIKRSRTADPDLDNFTHNQWDTSESLHISNETRKYHYLTRSQSALTYPPKSRLNSRRSFNGYGASNSGSVPSASFYPMTSSPLRTEFDPREPEASGIPEAIHRRSQFVMSQPTLSPIDERSLHERLESDSLNYKYVHSDNTSMHSSKLVYHFNHFLDSLDWHFTKIYLLILVYLLIDL